MDIKEGPAKVNNDPALTSIFAVFWRGGPLLSDISVIIELLQLAHPLVHQLAIPERAKKFVNGKYFYRSNFAPMLFSGDDNTFF